MNYMFNIFKLPMKYIKYNFFDSKQMLGRWSVSHCDKINHIKSNLANTDNCGDVICGDPLYNKKTYDNYVR